MDQPADKAVRPRTSTWTRDDRPWLARAEPAEAGEQIAPEPYPQAPPMCRGLHSEKSFGILTSGGDAPGMGSAVRGATATALSHGATVYAIMNGYAGLVAGGDMIKPLTWADLDGNCSAGGTPIGSARCAEFRTTEGRRKAALNMVRLGMNHLIVVGGDGSLTGADIFKAEWSAHLDALVAADLITTEQRETYGHLSVVGLVGSIDNDLTGFSMTIGADTALQRISEACDRLITTAQSHQRTFIVEVMGRNCGFLALQAAIAVGADWVFVPESPPDTEDWETVLCESLKRRRAHKNYSLVIVAEGATDRVRRPIRSEYLKEVLSTRLGHDTRVTCLGHVQRGGAPSAYDRILASRSGAEAALAMLHSDASTPSRIVGIRFNQMVQIDLATAVAKCKELAQHLDARRFNEAMALRGPTFREELSVFRRVRKFLREIDPGAVPSTSPSYNVALICVGSPAAGTNAGCRTLVRELVNKGHRVFGVCEGFFGLAKGDFAELLWTDVSQWSAKGGTELGTNRSTPERLFGGKGLEMIADELKKHDIDALVAFGGFEAFEGMRQLYNARSQYESLRIPLVTIPATISNNVPGTDHSIGTDTAQNVIVECIDRLRLSARSSRARVFIVEVMGGYCGFLATMGALAGGADAVYTFEDGVPLSLLMNDVEHLRKKFGHFRQAIIVRNERCSERYTAGFMQALFEEEGELGEQKFSVRNITLGHLQQGGSPSPLDRVRAARLSSVAVDTILRFLDTNSKGAGTVNSPESACVVGVRGSELVATSFDDLVDDTDGKHRKPRSEWWASLRPLVRTLETNSAGCWGEECQYLPQSVICKPSDIWAPDESATAAFRRVADKVRLAASFGAACEGMAEARRKASQLQAKQTKDTKTDEESKRAAVV